MDPGIVWLDQTRWQCTIKILAIFTTAFCLSHVEHKLINLTLYNNSSAQAVNNIFEKFKEHTVKCTVQTSTHNTVQSFGKFGQMIECSFAN